jgi:hypothetical protein
MTPQARCCSDRIVGDTEITPILPFPGYFPIDGQPLATVDSLWEDAFF